MKRGQTEMLNYSGQERSRASRGNNGAIVIDERDSVSGSVSGTQTIDRANNESSLMPPHELEAVELESPTLRKILSQPIDMKPGDVVDSGDDDPGNVAGALLSQAERPAKFSKAEKDAGQFASEVSTVAIIQAEAFPKSAPSACISSLSE